MKKSIIATLFILTIACGNLSSAVIINDPYAGSPSSRLGKGIGQGIAEELKRQTEENNRKKQIEYENQMFEMREKKHQEQSYYNNVIQSLNIESSHEKIKIPEEMQETTVRNPYIIETNDGHKIEIQLITKFERVLSDGITCEWSWILNIKNITGKKLFCYRSIDYSSVRMNIELYDKDIFILSSCVSYVNMKINANESITFRGKWIIPYDKISKIEKYNIIFG